MNNSLPEDLRIWLRERKPTSLWQAATLADHYALARRRSQRSQNPNKPTLSTVSTVRPQETSATNLSGQVHRDRLPSGLAHNNVGCSQTNLRDDKKCFQCGKFGHLMYNCPNRQVQETKQVLSGVKCDEVA